MQAETSPTDSNQPTKRPLTETEFRQRNNAYLTTKSELSILAVIHISNYPAQTQDQRASGVTTTLPRVSRANELAFLT